MNEKDFKYSIKEDNTIEIVRYVGEDKCVIIPKALYGRIVTSVNDDAFADCPDIESITIVSNRLWFGYWSHIGGARRANLEAIPEGKRDSSYDTYRGRCIDNGKWVTGFYVESNGYYYILVPTLKFSRKTFTDDFQVYEVSPETVCRCIGKTDNYGNDIFVRDILMLNNTKYVVDKDEDDRFYGKQCATNDLATMCDTLKWCELDFAVVIGNIYDNPELLKGE